MKVGAPRNLLIPAVYLVSLALATPETCQQQEQQDYDEERGAVQFLQRHRSHRVLEETKVPGFLPDIVINLDLAPRDRFREWARWRASVMGPDDPRLAVGPDGLRHEPVKAWIDLVISPQEQEEWVQVLKSSIESEYLEELAGIEEELAKVEQASGRQLPFVTKADQMLLLGSLYELQYPNVGCTGILVALPNGTVMHGRNMDYFLYGMTNRNITHKLTFVRGGKPLFMSISMGLAPPVATAIRFGGWSVELNAHAANDRLANLESGKAGGKVNAWTLRHLMETVPDFETALLRMRQTRWMAPQYVVVAGAGPNEGAVLTLHRAEKEAASWTEAGNLQPMLVERRLEPASGVWYMAQTNDEAWEAPEDARRPFEQAWLRSRGQDNTTAEDIMTLLRTPPARQSSTQYSIVMVPATNYSDLVISTTVSP